MNWNQAVTQLAEQPWVRDVAGALEAAAGAIFGRPGGGAENFLHGTWLGHPLHPVLTDIPLGAWTVTVLLDASDALSGGRRLGAAADRALGIGLLGALGSAVSGVADWGRLNGEPQRVGAVHALLNSSATALFALSLFARGARARGIGRALALAGYGLVAGGAYLGGHLVFAQQVGVDHTADKPVPDGFKRVMADADLMEGELRRVEAGEASVLLVRRAGHVYAMSDVCSHLGCSLADGHLEEESVRCECHGSRYALADGRVLDGPSAYWQPAYRTRVRDGQIEVGGPLSLVPGGQPAGAM